MNLKKVAKRAKEYKHVLIIMRHAKTEAFNAKGDFERVLTDKGLKQAKRVAKGLRDMGLDAGSDRLFKRHPGDADMRAHAQGVPATLRKSTTTRISMRKVCRRCSTCSLPARTNAMRCWCSAMSPPSRWRAQWLAGEPK